MLRIGYLMNTYPVTSGTFIRREIQAIEAEGVAVRRFAIRRWSESLVDPRDQEEQAKTEYILSGQVPLLLLHFLAELVANPRGVARAVPAWWRLWRNGHAGFVTHVAYLLEAASLKRRLGRESVTHIHSHFSTNATAVALLCHRMGGPGYSFTAHGPDEFLDMRSNSGALKIAEARFVVAISNFCRVQLTLVAGMQTWDRIHVIGCGINTDEFAPSSAPFSDDASFVSIGRLCPQKAQVLVVRAVAQVVADHPDVQVQLVGDGETRAMVEAEIAKHGIDRNVHLLGWQSNTQVRELLGQARALLLPSFAEGLPVGIMEALALERPVISTFIAGIPELVDRDCGWIIPAGSEDQIAEAMRAALASPPELLSAMGQEGRRRVLERHDVRKNARALLACIRSYAGETK